MPTAHVNGIEMFYDSRGSGDPLLLIMGLGANLDWWGDDFLNTLARSYRVIAFDNRGAGRTEAPEGPYSVAQFATDTAALTDVLGIARCHVFGYSMGGMIAQELALRYPEKVNRLILGSTTCGGKENVAAAPEVLGLLAQETKSLEEFRDNTMRILFPPEYIESHADFIVENWQQISQHPTDRQAFMNQLMAIATWPGTYDRLPTLTVPTLVVHGTADVLVPPENGSLLAEQIPGAKLVTFDNCGHGLPAQEPEAVLRTVLDFLS